MPAGCAHAVAAAFVSGFRWVMLMCAGLALLSAASAWWMIGGKTAPVEAATHDRKVLDV